MDLHSLARKGLSGLVVSGMACSWLLLDAVAAGLTEVKVEPAVRQAKPLYSADKLLGHGERPWASVPWVMPVSGAVVDQSAGAHVRSAQQSVTLFRKPPVWRF